MVKKTNNIDPLLADEETPTPEEAEAKPKTVATLGKAKPTEVDIVAQTKAKLDAQEHVNFIIPMADGERAGAYDSVQINGYKLTIQKGVMVSIAKDIANLLAEKYRINMSLGANKRIDRTNEAADALA